MPDYNIEVISDKNYRLGEGPLWDYRENALYWVDIRGRTIQRYYPASGQQDIFEIGSQVGCMGLRAGGGFVLATQAGFAFWNPDGNRLEALSNPEEGRPEMRFNDGAVDRQGRFWAGSMYDKPKIDVAEGTLYRLNPGGEVRPMQERVAIPNGLGWSPDNTVMYHTDSPRKIIYAYDFDPATGDIANRRPFIDSSDEDGEPDGLAVDAQGCIWGARWGGSTVTQYDPRGRKLQVIKMPVEQPTCCAFGGENLDELYITSAYDGLDAAHLAGQPLAGRLFRVKVDAQGLKTTPFGG